MRIIKNLRRTTQYLLLIAVMFIFSSCSDELQEEEVAIPTIASKANQLPKNELAKLRNAVAPYHNFKKAMEAGYTLETTGYRSGMGFHYLKPSLADAYFELEKPEVLLFAPGANGKLRFVGVEYIVPIADISNPPPAPEGFTGDADVWEIVPGANVWALHVWVGLQNPNGIFEPLNPRLP